MAKIVTWRWKEFDSLPVIGTAKKKIGRRMSDSPRLNSCKSGNGIIKRILTNRDRYYHFEQIGINDWILSIPT